MVTNTRAAAIFVFAFVPIAALAIAARLRALELTSILLLSSIVAIAIGFVSTRGASTIPEGRKIVLRDKSIQQFDENGEVVAEVDASRPYEYNLSPLGHSGDAIVRLYQGDSIVEFYLSDPGAEKLRESVLRFPWPPPPNPKG